VLAIVAIAIVVCLTLIGIALGAMQDRERFEVAGEPAELSTA
jgi:hypothetical protein